MFFDSTFYTSAAGNSIMFIFIFSPYITFYGPCIYCIEFDSQLFGIKLLFPSFLKRYSGALLQRGMNSKGVVETDGFSGSLPKFCYDEHVFFQLPDWVKNQSASMDRGQQGLG